MGECVIDPTCPDCGKVWYANAPATTAETCPDCRRKALALVKAVCSCGDVWYVDEKSRAEARRGLCPECAMAAPEMVPRPFGLKPAEYTKVTRPDPRLSREEVVSWVLSNIARGAQFFFDEREIARGAKFFVDEREIAETPRDSREVILASLATVGEGQVAIYFPKNLWWMFVTRRPSGGWQLVEEWHPIRA